MLLHVAHRLVSFRDAVTVRVSYLSRQLAVVVLSTSPLLFYCPTNNDSFIWRFFICFVVISDFGEFRHTWRNVNMCVCVCLCHFTVDSSAEF